jgi:hypothetical protein
MENRINVHNQYNNINNEFNNNPEEINNSDFNSKIFHYKEFLLNLEKEFSSNNDKLKKISTLKDQINEISNNIKELNNLEIQNGINNPSNYSSQTKSINNLSLILSTLEKNFLKKQKINDKIISKMSRKIKDTLLYNKEIKSIKEEIEFDKKEKIDLNKTIKESNMAIPSLKTDLNLNKHKYSKLLEEYQKVEKDNFIRNEKMYGEIIEYGNKVRILEERKEKLRKFKEEQIQNLEKMKKIEELEKILNKEKKEKEIAEKENNEYEKLINDFVTHLNLNYINLMNLKEQINPINQNEINMEKYILNKNNQSKIVEQQIENIINKYY